MPWIGSAPNQTTQRTDGTRTGSTIHADQKTASIKIKADLTDTENQDLSDMIDDCLMKTGGNFNADIPTSGNKFTGVGNATARTHFASAGQIADGALTYAGTSAGTDTITATLSPAITAYVTGQIYHFKAGGTNTGAATINFNSVGAKSIKKGADGATALIAGDITTGGDYIVIYDGTNFQLLNPGSLNITITAAGAAILDDADAAAQRTTLGVPATSSVLAVANNLSDVASASTAFGNIKQAASTAATGVVQLADAAAMEAQTSGLAVTADLQARHPGHPKFWAYVTNNGTTAIAASFNTTSVTDNGTGDTTVTIATDFSSANWAPAGMCTRNNTVNIVTVEPSALAAGTVEVTTRNGNNVVGDADFGIVGFGDQ